MPRSPSKVPDEQAVHTGSPVTASASQAEHKSGQGLQFGYPFTLGLALNVAGVEQATHTPGAESS